MLALKRLNHVQLCVPPGKEAAAREFYCGMLGLAEIAKPEALIPHGGFWLQAGDVQLHIGVEDGRSTSKRHPAFEVADIAEARRELERCNVPIREETPVPGQKRLSFRDPFGNRIELLQIV